ncbi:hypothetical protein BD413DRAFT_470556 [Trametes elegans]|nr:hypothetical protein BD413DRAFT_470556 [Trametes elegans]
MNLPFDIIHSLLDHSTILDIVSFCSTCKPLRSHLRNDSIWRRACLAYGLRDLTHFGGQSAYTVYTQLLHPYGPLLGLWANDSPFYGRIMEFTVRKGNTDEQGGIIGEVWTFPPNAPPDAPAHPSFVRVVKLSFEDGNATTSELRNQLHETKSTDVRVFCDTGPQVEGVTATPATRHSCSLVKMSETTLGQFLQFYRRKVNLPDFPPHISPWYDKARGLPRIPEVPETRNHHREVIKLYPAARLPAVFVAPTFVMKPPAITIRCSRPPEECPCHSLHATALPFANLDLRPPRYYPLEGAFRSGSNMDDGALGSVDELGGLWYGSYGPNGTECIYLATDDVGEKVEATKITGDVHVPRGCMSWAVYQPPEDERQALEDFWEDVRTDGVVPCKVLTGHGIFAASGFTDLDVVAIIAGVISADHIEIFWERIHEFRTYRRYKGRDTTSS